MRSALIAARHPWPPGVPKAPKNEMGVGLQSCVCGACVLTWYSPAPESCEVYHNMQALLEEYEVCGKFDETVCCLRSLDAPHYHHELTKRALLAAFEKPDQAPALLELLQRLTDTGVVSQVTAHLPPS